MKFKGMEKVGDLLLTNLLFVLCSLPVVTLGASATAMHYVLGRIRRQEGTVTRDFFRSFRENFKQAMLYWCGFLLAALALYWNFRLVSGWTGPMYSVFMVLLILVSWFALSWVSLVFPLLSRFDNSLGAMAKNAAILVLAAPLRTLCAVILNLIPVALALVLPGIFALAAVLWLFCLCAVSGLAIQLLLAPVFSRLEGNSGPEENGEDPEED